METIKDLIEYNPETGTFKWKVSRGGQLPGKSAGIFNDQGYRIIQICGKNYRGARLAWYLTHGRWPIGEIDHINRDPTDDRLVNLRDVSHSVNGANSPTRASSGKKGVYRNGRGWMATAYRNYKSKYLGTFSTKEEAVKARDEWLKQGE